MKWLKRDPIVFDPQESGITVQIDHLARGSTVAPAYPLARFGNAFPIDAITENLVSGDTFRLSWVIPDSIGWTAKLNRATFVLAGKTSANLGIINGDTVMFGAGRGPSGVNAVGGTRYEWFEALGGPKSSIGRGLDMGTLWGTTYSYYKAFTCEGVPLVGRYQATDQFVRYVVTFECASNVTSGNLAYAACIDGLMWPVDSEVQGLPYDYLMGVPPSHLAEPLYPHQV